MASGIAPGGGAGLTGVPHFWQKIESASILWPQREQKIVDADIANAVQRDVKPILSLLRALNQLSNYTHS